MREWAKEEVHTWLLIIQELCGKYPKHNSANNVDSIQFAGLPFNSGCLFDYLKMLFLWKFNEWNGARLHRVFFLFFFKWRGTEWCGACTRCMVFSNFLMKRPPFRHQLFECFHEETTFFQVHVTMSWISNCLRTGLFIKEPCIELVYLPNGILGWSRWLQTGLHCQDRSGSRSQSWQK